MQDSFSLIKQSIDEHIRLAKDLHPMANDLTSSAHLATSCIRSGGRLLFCDNGDPATDAQHLSAEFVGHFLRDRVPLDAIALQANTSTLTAVGNDYDFNQILAREVRAHGRKNDFLIGISTNGNSPTIIEAINSAKEMEILTFGLTGGDGGKMVEVCDLTIAVPSKSTLRIREMHILLGHIFCQLVEKFLCSTSQETQQLVSPKIVTTHISGQLK